MAQRSRLSQGAISRIWRTFGLRPHRTEIFKLSSDPAFIEKVLDVVGLYLAPPDRALVLCVDEKPQIQAVQGTTPAPPSRDSTASSGGARGRCEHRPIRRGGRGTSRQRRSMAEQLARFEALRRALHREERAGSTPVGP